MLVKTTLAWSERKEKKRPPQSKKQKTTTNVLGAFVPAEGCGYSSDTSHVALETWITKGVPGGVDALGFPTHPTPLRRIRATDSVSP